MKQSRVSLFKIELLGLTIIYPLITINGYYNIVQVKVAFAGLLVLACFWGMVLSSIKKCMDNDCLRLPILSNTDKAFILFMIIQAVVFAGAADKKISWFGANADGMGFFFYILMLLLYTTIRNEYRYDKIHLSYIFIAADILIILAVIQFMGFDILRLFPNDSTAIKTDYLSTLGNTGIFACCVSILLPFVMNVFCRYEKSKQWILSFVTLLICYFGILCSNCDVAYIGLLLSLIGTAINLIFDKTKSSNKLIDRRKVSDISSIKMYCILVMCFFTSSAIFGLIHRIFSGSARNLSAITKMFTYYEWSFDKEKISNYLVYNDKWGTDRGYIWSRLMDVYCNKSNLWQKLFGFGQGTVSNVIDKFFGVEMRNDMEYIYSDAHSEIISILISCGVVGLLAYLVIIATLIYDCIKMYNRYDFVMLLSILIYFSISIFGLYQPISGIFMWMLIALLAARKNQARLHYKQLIEAKKQV